MAEVAVKRELPQRVLQRGICYANYFLRAFDDRRSEKWRGRLLAGPFANRSNLSSRALLDGMTHSIEWILANA